VYYKTKFYLKLVEENLVYMYCETKLFLPTTGKRQNCLKLVKENKVYCQTKLYLNIVQENTVNCKNVDTYFEFV
jgi:hypothetical protein